MMMTWRNIKLSFINSIAESGTRGTDTNHCLNKCGSGMFWLRFLVYPKHHSPPPGRGCYSCKSLE